MAKVSGGEELCPMVKVNGRSVVSHHWCQWNEGWSTIIGLSTSRNWAPWLVSIGGGIVPIVGFGGRKSIALWFEAVGVGGNSRTPRAELSQVKSCSLGDALG